MMAYSVDDHQKSKPLPRSLRADVVVKTPLACRFGWHQIFWEPPVNHHKQFGTCIKCNAVKKRWL